MTVTIPLRSGGVKFVSPANRPSISPPPEGAAPSLLTAASISPGDALPAKMPRTVAMMLLNALSTAAVIPLVFRNVPMPRKSFSIADATSFAAPIASAAGPPRIAPAAVTTTVSIVSKLFSAQV